MYNLPLSVTQMLTFLEPKVATLIIHMIRSVQYLQGNSDEKFFLKKLLSQQKNKKEVSVTLLEFIDRIVNL